MGTWFVGSGSLAPSGATAAQIFGIKGAVDTYDLLPSAATLDESTIYSVRQDGTGPTAAPNGNGLYWVQSGAWAFLDSLNLQDSDEVPNQSAVAGVTVTNALDTLGTAPPAHASSHENGGADEVSVAGLSGLLADPQTPATHASSHQNGGADEIATATPGANAIPKADGSGNLTSWIAAATTTTSGIVELATDGESAANVVVQGNDARLSDARTPTSHASSHNSGGADAMAIDAVAGTGSLRTLGTGATNACAGDDSRLSDARTPTSHASSHNSGGADAMAIDAVAGTGSLRTLGTGSTNACAGDDSRLSDARIPTSHASSHNSGGADAMAIDAAAGTGSLRTLGTGATNACAGDDSRLSDTRVPTSHASTHDSGGADAMAIDAAAGTGSLRTLGTGSTNACAGDDSRLSDARTPTAHASDHTDGTDDVADLVGDSGSGGTHGLAPAPGAGDTAANKFLKADGTWSVTTALADGEDIVVGTTTGTKIGTATSQKLGFYNATPVIQQNGTGETTGFTAGTGTAVNDDSTFTGNVGATAYRISDIVKGLKNMGLLAS